MPCPGAVWAGIGSLGSRRNCHMLPRQVPDPLILAMMWPPAVPLYITADMEKLPKSTDQAHKLC